MTGLELLLACGASRQGRFADLAPLCEALRRRGWSHDRLAKNDLLADPDGAGGRAGTFVAFWTTIAELTRCLAPLGIDPVFIKCLREYRYCDSNVDVLVPRRELTRVARHLSGHGWLAPRPRDRIEQWAIERAKLKLPSSRKPFLAAHLYGAVSWRYQSDIGLLRHDGIRPDAEHCRREAIADVVEGASADGVQGVDVWLPRDAAEFVLQAAHIAFENYRITLGEAVHFRLLRQRAAADWPAAEALARSFGCHSALQLMDRLTLEVCSALPDLDPADYPRTLPVAALAPAFSERARWLLAHGRPVSAVVEPATGFGVWCAVSLIRRGRRWRRGAEDYRPSGGGR